MQSCPGNCGYKTNNGGQMDRHLKANPGCSGKGSSGTKMSLKKLVYPKKHEENDKKGRRGPRHRK